MKINKTFVAQLNNDPEAVLKTLEIEEIVELIQTANHSYYNKGSPLVSDQIFDIIKDYLAVLQPGHPVLTNIGATVGTSNKVPLPFFMGSLDKIKNDEKVFANWKKKYEGEYVISDKLDGNSGLLVLKNNEVKLYTRGDGIDGQDISHLLPFLKNASSLVVSVLGKNTNNVAVRGELIIGKDDFEMIKHKGANARNTVAGLLNAKIPDVEVGKLTMFVAYEVIFPILSPKDQMNFIIKTLGIDCVWNQTLQNTQLSLDKLSNALVERRKVSPYEIDGIVVSHNNVYKRLQQNPEHSFAFKSVITMERAEVIVTKVEWNMSKDGIFVPVVHFTPVALDGVIITKAHGFNGKFIKDNVIAPGAVIIIMRSGAVIPYIVEVVKKASKPQMPEVDYVWSKTKVDIMVDKSALTDTGNDELQFKNIEYFFDKVDVPGLSGGIIKRIFDKGFKTIGSIVSITKEQLLSVEGFKDKLATKVHTAINDKFANKGANIDLFLLMDASNILGRGIGSKKIKLICDVLPDIVTKRYVPTVQELVTIKGVESKTAELFVNNLPLVYRFFDDNGLFFGQRKNKGNKESNVVSSPTAALRIVGKSFVFSGVRDITLEEFIAENGGAVSTSVSSKTSMVVVKDLDSDSSKVTKAKSLNIPIITLEDFRNELGIGL
jgi:DNA ligase (NAD+)